jgi:hypothetical protein
MNITTTSLKLYQVYERNEKIDLPPIVTERIQSMLTDPDEFSSPDAACCWLYRHMTYSRTTFTTDTSFKRSESHCILVPGTQFWQYVQGSPEVLIVEQFVFTL